MARVMFDSTTPDAIPANAAIVGGYVNGSYAWPAAAWARFPDAQQVRITVTADPALGNCLDVEKGDAAPDQAPGWIKARQAAGVKFVTIYCNRSTLPAVDAACAGLTYYRWIATLDGTLYVPGFTAMAGPAAVQFAGSGMAGANVDISIVWEDGWHPTPAQSLPAQALTDAEAVTTAAGNLVTLLKCA